MANSDEKDLMAIGSHCEFPDCAQLDFLPFRCDCCGKTFCLEHRTYAAHSCRSAGRQEAQVFVCPLCAKAVKMDRPGEDANAAWDRHCRTDCDPSNYDRVHRKKKCPVAGCKEKLTSINVYTCRDCAATVCLKHRLPMDHKCPGKASAAAAAAQSRFTLPQAFKGLFSGSNSSSSTAAARAGGRAGVKPAAAAAAKPTQQPVRGKASAAAGAGAAKVGSSSSVAAQLQQYRAAQQQRSGGGAAAVAASSGQQSNAVDLTGSLSPAAGGAPAAGGGGPEVCQQCGARFGSVQALIEHAESAHMDGWSSGSVGARQQQRQQQGGGGLERCPHCGRQFEDAVALVSHVEREHAGSQKEGCVLC